MFTEDLSSNNAYPKAPDNVRLGINTSNNPGRSNWSWSLVRDINQMLENSAASDIEDAEQFEIGTNIILKEEGHIMSNYTYKFDESKNYYFPVPVHELSLNPYLEQIPGWE